MPAFFHYACHVRSLEDAVKFYCDLLGCTKGRSTETWVDIDFFGHQLSLHIGEPLATQPTGIVEGIKVPMPHFGAILPSSEWRILAHKLEGAGIDFILNPTTRFEGEAGEQNTMFFTDPSGNAIEIKGFTDMSGIFTA
ncbi:VOC family protein [Kordiimonas laminariae]|uniref:VOC family protein n=1 Tax=Kordiimonas laminariae TaxID=2917717 RepID=UPI001FF4770E|nr:VOC family protein [Kordiimonas laminariae]MCK0070369.1 VOC family protein [Kordiimonas laminariae]